MCDADNKQTKNRSITQYPFNNGIRDGTPCPALEEIRTSTDLECVQPSICQTIASIQPIGAASMFEIYGCDKLLNCTTSPPSLNSCLWRDSSESTPIDLNRMCNFLIKQNTTSALNLAAAAGCALPPPPPPPTLSEEEIAAGNNILTPYEVSGAPYFTVTITKVLTNVNTNVQNNVGKKIRVYYNNGSTWYSNGLNAYRPFAVGLSSNWVYPETSINIMNSGQVYAYNETAPNMFFAANNAPFPSGMAFGFSKLDQDVLTTGTMLNIMELATNNISPIKVSWDILKPGGIRMTDIMEGTVVY